jgi:hypothetical protein
MENWTDPISPAISPDINAREHPTLNPAEGKKAQRIGGEATTEGQR